MQLVNVSTPTNAQLFFSKLLSIVAFDIIDGTPIEAMIGDLFVLQETDPLTINFDALGYESSLFVPNMGSLIFAYLLFPIVLPIVAIVRWCTPKASWVYKKADAFLKRACFNSIISFIDESYLITAICSFTNIYAAIHERVDLDL